MTIVLRHNPTLELNLAEYSGQISFAQLKELAAYGARHPEFLKSDTLNYVASDTDFSAVDLHDLDLLFLRYRKLYARLDFQIYRRSAWLCRSPAAERHVAYWLNGRDLKEGMSSAVRPFETFAEAGDWLLLSGAEIAAVERGEDFIELVRFDTAPVAAAAL